MLIDFLVIHHILQYWKQLREVTNLIPTPTVMQGDPTDVISTGTGTLSYMEDNMSNDEVMKQLISFLKTEQNVTMELRRTIHL